MLLSRSAYASIILPEELWLLHISMRFFGTYGERLVGAIYRTPLTIREATIRKVEKHKEKKNTYVIFE